MQRTTPVSQSVDYDTNFQSPRKEGLTDRLRQRLNAAGKIIQGDRPNSVSEPVLKNLTTRSQVR